VDDNDLIEGSPTTVAETAPDEVRDVPSHRPKKSFFARHFGMFLGGGIVVIILAIAGGAWLWYSGAEDGSPGTGVVVSVTSGQGFAAIRSSLERAGVVTNSLAFDFYVFVHGTPAAEPGEYFLPRNDSFADVVGILNNGPNVLTLQIPSGFTVSEVADRMESAGYDTLGTQFVTIANSGSIRSPFQPPGSKNLDGLLGTGTYQVLPTESAKTLLAKMIGSFTATAKAAGLVPGQTANGLSAYQTIVVASIVEKEGYIDKNMPKVSRVIYNRLANDMPLQMDSTVLYSLGQDGGTVTPADLRIKSPYNTYLNKGLTPTPICFPSTNALEAALNPPPGKWLYFVVVSQDGTEAFSDTYAGQVANEKIASERGLP